MSKPNLILWILIPILFAINIQKSLADHMLGGEISYTWLGGNIYNLSIDYYRDCNGIPANVAAFTVWDSKISKNFTPSFSSGSTDITPIAGGSCTRCSNSLCTYPFGIKKYTLTVDADLSAFTDCILYIQWSQAATNPVSTVNSSSGTAIFVMAVLNRCHGDHNSPRFQYDPQFIAGTNQLTDQYQTVTPDNPEDSIYYRISQPMVSLNYYSGYNYLEPISYRGKPSYYRKKPYGFHYDSLSGEMYYTATKAETGYFSYEADEYKKDGAGKYYLAGNTLRFIVLTTLSIKNNYPTISNAANNSITNPFSYSSDSITACVGTPLNLLIKANDIDNGDTVNFTALNEVPGAALKLSNYSPTVALANFSWTPGNKDVRKRPYIFTLTATDRGKPAFGFTQRRFYLFVNDSLPATGLTVKNNGCGNYSFGLKNSIDKRYSISWLFDSIPFSKSTTASYKNTIAGKHFVSLIISNTYGCCEVYSDTLYYDTAYAAPVKESGICLGDTIHIITVKGSGIHWTPAAGLSDSTSNNPFASPLTTTTYTSISKDASGCDVSNKIKIDVSNFKVSFTGKNAVCQGNSTPIKVNSISGSVLTWNPDSGITGYQNDTFIVTPQKTTTYKVTAVYKQCVQSDSIKLYVNPTIIDLGKEKTVCPLDTVSVIAPFRKDSRYIYYDAQHFTILDSSSNQYHFMSSAFQSKRIYALKETDSIGCVSNGTVNVNTLDFNPVLSGKYKMCYGDSIKLSVSAGNRFLWKNNGQIISANNTVTISPKSNSMFYITAIDTLHGCSKTDSINISVIPRPSVLFHKIIICPGASAALMATGGDEYSWSPIKALDHPNTANPVADPDITTTYLVAIKESSTGCQQEDSITVVVNDCVWPGDANKDHRADFLDVLNIGTGYGQTGPPRIPASTQWKAWSGDDWPGKTGTGINFKHLDCNGDGIIDYKDTGAISLNYQQKHYLMAYQAGAPPVYIKFAKDTFYLGDTVTGWIFAGNNNQPLYDAYGFGFQGNIDGPCLADHSLWMTSVSDFFCHNANVLNYQKLTSETDFEGASVETSGNTCNNGHGAIAAFSILLKDSLAFSYPEDGEQINANLLFANAIDNTGKDIPVNIAGNSALVLKHIHNRITADFISSRSDCEPLTSHFSPLITDLRSNTFSYEWDFGDGAAHSTAKNPIHVYHVLNNSQIQTYDVSLKITDSLGYTAETVKKKWILVYAKPSLVMTATPKYTTLDNPVIQFDISDQSRNINLTDSSNTYEWLFGDQNNPDRGGYSNQKSPAYTYRDTGTYAIRLKASNNLGCFDSIETSGLFHIGIGFSVFIPNIFIPNHSAKNQVFKPVISEYASYRITIFNRWNQVVFSSNDPNLGWKGDFNGHPSPEGVYFYQIKAVNLGGKEFEYKGNVTLIR